jgi:hypothetical protein
MRAQKAKSLSRLLCDHAHDGNRDAGTRVSGGVVKRHVVGSCEAMAGVFGPTAGNQAILCHRLLQFESRLTADTGCWSGMSECQSSCASRGFVGSADIGDGGVACIGDVGARVRQRGVVRRVAAGVC